MKWPPEPADGEGAEQARDWQMAVEQAEKVARLAGKMPAGAQRSVEASKAAKVDWRELLRAHGRRPFQQTIAGPDRTVATCGLASTFPALSARELARHASPSIALARSMIASSGYSRRRCVPFSPASNRGSSTLCTLTLKYRRWRPTRPGSRSSSRQLEEAGPTSGPVSPG